MTYALRVYLAHTGNGFAACARLFETLAGRDHDLRVGRHEGLEAPVAEVESWREDFEIARSMRATASLDGLSVSMSIELVPVPTMLVSIPTDDEQAGIATASSLASSLDVDFGVLQALPSAPPTVLATDEDRLAYLALASTNLGGERFESTGPVATGTLTFVSSRLLSASRGSLQLQEVQGLTTPSIAALQSAGIGATSSHAPNNARRLSFTKGPRWVALPRAVAPGARDAAGQLLEEKLALSAKEQDLVDFEDPEVPEGTPLLFLTAPDAKAEMLALVGSALRWSLLDRATLSESAFIDCDLLGSRCNGARLLELRLEGCRVSHTSFQDAVIAGGLVRSCDFHGARFERAQLTNTQFRDCDFRGTHFDDATFDRVTFEGCRLDPATATAFQRRGARVQ